MNNLLDDDKGVTVLHSVIPAIQQLHHILPPLKWASVLGLTLVESRLFSLQLESSFLCSDLKKSDLFFNSLKNKWV